MSGNVTQIITQERAEEVLTSWFPEYEGVGTVIADAAHELVNGRAR